MTVKQTYETSKTYVTWGQIYKFLTTDGFDHITHFMENNRVDGVYGPPRGGLPMAVIMSHRYGLPILMSPTENCIIVDDINDTGETLKKYANIPGIYMVAYACKSPERKDAPDLWVIEKKDDWMVFPWEWDN